MKPSRISAIAVSVILFLLFLILYFSPCLREFGSVVPSYFPDTFHFIWNAWWAGHVISEENINLYNTTLIFWPFGTSLYLHSLTEGVFVPLTIVFRTLSPTKIYTLAAFFCFLGNFLASFLIFQKVSSNNFLSFLLAVALSFHPYFVGHLGGGHINMLAAFPAFLFFYFIPAEDDLRWLRLLKVALSTLSLVWVGFTNLYYFYFALIVIFLLFFESIILRTFRIFVGKYLIPFVAGCVILSSHLLHIYTSASSHFFTPNHNPARHGIDLVHLFVPGKHQVFGELFSFSTFINASTLNAAESGAYIGWSIIILILIVYYNDLRLGFQRRQLLPFAGLIFIFLSFGSIIKFLGVTQLSNTLFEIAFGHLPLFPSVPARFFIMGQFSFFLYIAAAYKFIPGLKNIILICVFFAVIEMFPLPLKTMTINSSPMLERLRNDDQIVIYDTDLASESTMIRQTFHAKPIVGGFIARRPREALREYRRNLFCHWLQDESNHMDESRIKSAWHELQANAILVPSSDKEKIDKLALLSWLYQDDSDSAFRLYREKK